MELKKTSSLLGKPVDLAGVLQHLKMLRSVRCTYADGKESEMERDGEENRQAPILILL